MWPTSLNKIILNCYCCIYKKIYKEIIETKGSEGIRKNTTHIVSIWMWCGKFTNDLNLDLREWREECMDYILSCKVILTSAKENWVELSLGRKTNYVAMICLNIDNRVWCLLYLVSTANEWNLRLSSMTYGSTTPQSITWYWILISPRICRRIHTKIKLLS